MHESHFSGTLELLLPNVDATESVLVSRDNCGVKLVKAH
jgi:hypothetical protein